MRYHYTKKVKRKSIYGIKYFCNHPVYNCCTLYKIHDRGIAVIQQKVTQNKYTYWTCIDEYLIDDIYLNENFKRIFDERAKVSSDGLYPTISIRQLMWALKMKPLKRERWETCFDRKDI